MDSIKIGRFIAETKKPHKLTQAQLARTLNISDKTASKWECGKGLPEVYLMLPLCKSLEISVNDLLSGERVSAPDYCKKAEESKKKFFVSVLNGVTAIIAVLSLVLLAA